MTATPLDRLLYRRVVGRFATCLAVPDASGEPLLYYEGRYRSVGTETA